METVYEGTLEEILAHRDELQDRRLRVTVLDTSDEGAIRERVAKLERGLAMVRELGKDLPPYPRRELTLDVFYPDEDEPR